MNKIVKQVLSDGSFHVVLGIFSKDSPKKYYLPSLMAAAADLEMRSTVLSEYGDATSVLKEIPPEQRIQRATTVDKSRECCKITSIKASLDHSDVMGEFVTVTGIVTPTGPFKDDLIKHLNDPNSEAKFGMRAITVTDVLPQREEIRKVINIISWDLCYPKEPTGE